MKKLLEMIACVERQDGIPDIDNTSASAKPKMENSAFHWFVDQCQPFVFSPTGSVEELDDSKKITDFDAPFKIFSIEVDGDSYVTIARPEDALKFSIRCFLAVETASSWIYFAYGDLDKGGKKEEMVIVSRNSLNQIAERFVNRLNSNKEIVGVEKNRTRLKVGKGKTKRFLTLRSIIHVKPKNTKVLFNEESLGIAKEIVWTSRWWVRGHWRGLECTTSLGKDRNGLYGEAGRTWVTEHEKGPDNAIPIKKTRLVMEPKI